MLDIVAILECTRRTESGMWTFFHITAPQKHEKKLNIDESKVLFWGTPVKQESSGKVTLRNLLGLGEPLEAPDDQRFLTYIKILSVYMSDLEARFLGFSRD